MLAKCVELAEGSDESWGKAVLSIDILATANSKRVFGQSGGIALIILMISDSYCQYWAY